MLNYLSKTFKALDSLKKAIVVISFLIFVSGWLLTAKSIFFAAHDAKIATVEREKINKESQKQQQKTNDQINEFLAANSSAGGSNVFIERVLASSKASGGNKQGDDDELSEEQSNADADSQELSGADKNGRMGIKNELCSQDIHQCGFAELLQAYKAESEKQKPLCYPVESENDDGTTEISEICY